MNFLLFSVALDVKNRVEKCGEEHFLSLARYSSSTLFCLTAGAVELKRCNQDLSQKLFLITSSIHVTSDDLINSDNRRWWINKFQIEWRFHSSHDKETSSGFFSVLANTDDNLIDSHSGAFEADETFPLREFMRNFAKKQKSFFTRSHLCSSAGF